MSVGSNIKKLRDRKGLTQLEFGELFGVTDKAVSSWESETKTPRMGVLEKISQHFNVSKGTIIDGDVDEDDNNYDFLAIETIDVPLLGNVAAGVPILAEENFECYVAAGADVRCDFCLRVRGDSMINARIYDGDIVFVRQQPTVENGEIAVVLIDDEATLKRVYRYKNMLVLRAENPSFPEMTYEGHELEEIRIIGKAVAFQSDVR